MQIFYMEDAGFSIIDVPVEDSIKIAMYKAIQHFKSNGLETTPVSIQYSTHSVKLYLTQQFNHPGSNEKHARVNGNWFGKAF